MEANNESWQEIILNLKEEESEDPSKDIRDDKEDTN